MKFGEAILKYINNNKNSSIFCELNNIDNLIIRPTKNRTDEKSNILFVTLMDNNNNTRTQTNRNNAFKTLMKSETNVKILSKNNKKPYTVITTYGKKHKNFTKKH